MASRQPTQFDIGTPKQLFAKRFEYDKLIWCRKVKLINGYSRAEHSNGPNWDCGPHYCWQHRLCIDCSSTLQWVKKDVSEMVVCSVIDLQRTGNKPDTTSYYLHRGWWSGKCTRLHVTWCSMAEYSYGDCLLNIRRVWKLVALETLN
jgi:hypothetical protein